MKTSELIGHYLTARRANGTRLKSGQRLLYQFARETGDLPLAEVTPQAISVFLRGRGELSATWKTRYGLLTGLYRFAMARGHVKASPLPHQRPSPGGMRLPRIEQERHHPGEVPRTITDLVRERQRP